MNLVIQELVDSLFQVRMIGIVAGMKTKIVPNYNNNSNQPSERHHYIRVLSPTILIFPCSIFGADLPAKRLRL